MSLSGSRSRLAALTRDLSIRWRETRDHWTDAKGAEFEAQYLQGLIANMDRAVTALEQLDDLLKKARTDCE